MWHDKMTLQIIWPESAMNEVFDGAFLRWFDERRQKRQLVVEVLTTTKLGSNTLFTAAKDSKRMLGKDSTVPMATIIYAHKVAFISSGAEAFGFIVESKEFANQERLKFSALWKTSTVFK
jgi:hypothetical protein